MMLASGMLFGTVMGAMLAVSGGVLAALITHVLIRTAFGRWLDARAGETRISVRHFVESGNWLLLIIPRLIPVIPFFVINVGFTAAGVPKKSYLLSTFLGLTPIALIFAGIGSQLSNASDLSGMNAARLLQTPGMYVPLALLILLTLSGWLWLRARGKS